MGRSFPTSPSTWEFDSPPAVLKLGQAEELALIGSRSGTPVSGGTTLSLAEFQLGFPTFPNGQPEPVFQNFNGISQLLRMTAFGEATSPSTTVILRVGQPGTFLKVRASATGHLDGGCAVDWLYKWTTPAE